MLCGFTEVYDDDVLLFLVGLYKKGKTSWIQRTCRKVWTSNTESTSRLVLGSEKRLWPAATASSFSTSTAITKDAPTLVFQVNDETVKTSQSTEAVEKLQTTESEETRPDPVEQTSRDTTKDSWRAVSAGRVFFKGFYPWSERFQQFWTPLLTSFVCLFVCVFYSVNQIKYNTILSCIIYKRERLKRYT